MTGKTEALYVRVFEELVGRMQDLNIQPNPTDVTVDFEKAAHNAILEVFGAATRLHGCFFHLRQSTWRQVQSHGLTTLYNTEPTFAKQIRMIDALAYYPPPRVPAAFQDLKQTLDDARLTPIFQWFESTYVQGPVRARRGPRAAAAPALFPIPVWNLFRLTIDCDPTTNNCLEAWHNHLQHVLSLKKHPSIHKWLKGMKGEQAVIEMEIEQVLAGMPVKRQKKHEIDNREAIRDLCLGCASYTTVDYLSAVALRFKL